MAQQSRETLQHLRGNNKPTSELALSHSCTEDTILCHSDAQRTPTQTSSVGEQLFWQETIYFPPHSDGLISQPCIRLLCTTCC